MVNPILNVCSLKEIKVIPNWCFNTIRISGPRREIKKFEEHLSNTDGKDWFSYFVKPDRELAEDEWYGWNVENYGCKWNCDAIDWFLESPETISFTFDSPWGPPIVLYENIENIELESETGQIDYYKVDTEYLEEGMCFMGRFIDGEDEYYEYSNIESLDEIPEELVEHWGIRDRMLDDMENEDILIEFDEYDPEEEDEEEQYSQEEVEKALAEIKEEFDRLKLEEENEGTPPSDEEFAKQEETLKKTMKD